jgi:hypothetical protein
MFFLQQSVIQLRVGSNAGPRASKDELSQLIESLVTEKLLQLSLDVAGCASKQAVDQLSRSLTDRTIQTSADLEQVKDKLALVQVRALKIFLRKILSVVMYVCTYVRPYLICAYLIFNMCVFNMC